jgi:multidrug efflux pump subunit AcrA (membrane-fusion protein)
VRAGQPVEVYVGAFHSERFKGKIHSVGAVVNETTHALPVRVLLRNPEHKLKPSMHAEMHITVESDAPELLVPSRAIGIDGEENSSSFKNPIRSLKRAKSKSKKRRKSLPPLPKACAKVKRLQRKTSSF